MQGDLRNGAAGSTCGISMSRDCGWIATRLRRMDDSDLALTDSVLRIARRFELLRREVLVARDLEVWEYDVLAALSAAGTPYQLSPSALVSETQVASGTTTNRIDRLARRGYVTREPDPDVLVRLTTAGRRKVDTAAADIAESESATWAQISDRKRGQLAVTLEELQAQFDQ
jgi:DNA-binding MarR family transcriptional regulator